MSLVGNILWILLGGFIISIEYIIAGAILCLSIVGIPFGYQCFKLAVLALLPFGRKLETRPTASGCLRTLFNILWIVTGGLVISITHLLFAFLLALTIIGIPFARQHAKLATLALTPFGKNIH